MRIEEIVERNGKEIQTVVAMEELSELIQALSKVLRGIPDRDNLIEEIADVYIVLDEQRYIHGINLNDVIPVMVEKLEREEGRMKERKDNETD